MERRKVRTYDKEFKLNAVQLFHTSGKPYSQISKELGIPEAALAGWISAYKKERYKALEIFKRVDPEMGEKAMTLAEHFKVEGEQKGLRQGRLDERSVIAKNLLGMGLDLNSIKQATKLSEEKINQSTLSDYFCFSSVTGRPDWI